MKILGSGGLLKTLTDTISDPNQMPKVDPFGAQGQGYPAGESRAEGKTATSTSTANAMDTGTTNQTKGLPPSSLLDKVIHTVFGTPDSMLSPEDQQKKAQNKKKAGDLAQSAATNPGQAHMGIPSGGGGDLGDALSFIGKLMSVF